MNIARDFLVILLLILANGAFAMAETALLSARKARLRARADAGDHKARAALELAKAPGRFLSTVQIGITLVGILAGAFGGATAAQELAVQLSRIRWLEPYSQALALGIVVFVIAYLSLVVGELVPKRLALNNPERIAAAMAAPMAVVSSIAAPIVHLLSASTDLVLRVMGKSSSDQPITEEEVAIMIEEATQAGTFEPAEQKMVARVFSLGDRRVASLMTHRTEIVWLDVSDTIDEIRGKISATPHSQFPVCRVSLDTVLGVVHTKDLLAQSLKGQPLDLRASLRPPLFVPENMLALRLLDLFKTSEQKIALVIDEYGGVQGLVTINDILETVAGTFSRVDEPGAIRRPDGSWLVDGLLPVDEFREIISPARLPDEDDAADYETVGGLVMARLRKIPSAGDRFEWGGFLFEVLDMDGRRVDKVLVTPSARKGVASDRVSNSTVMEE